MAKRPVAMIRSVPLYACTLDRHDLCGAYELDDRTIPGRWIIWTCLCACHYEPVSSDVSEGPLSRESSQARG
jgi:hypothetical protein